MDPKAKSVGVRIARDMDSIRYVAERDIDLLVLEELHVSEPFRVWLAEKVFGRAVRLESFVGAWHSVTHVTGESDLEVDFIDAEGCHRRLLIENKIDANFQPAQDTRYTERGKSYLADGQCSSCHTALMAPEAYLEGRPELEEFDAALTYEELRDWFSQHTDLGERGRFKAKVVVAAIEQARRGYQPVVDANTNTFWQNYWLLVQESAPDLSMPKPSPKPKGSVWVYFKIADISPGLALLHKMPEGQVDLQIAGMGESVAILEKRLGPSLKPNMALVRASRSAAIRIRVPAIDMARTLDEQRNLVAEALEGARELRTWARDQREALVFAVGSRVQ